MPSKFHMRRSRHFFGPIWLVDYDQTTKGVQPKEPLLKSLQYPRTLKFAIVRK